MAAKETLNTRVTRLENAMAELAEKTTMLLDEQIKTDQRLREIAQESAERDRKLGERVENLVSAIGEFIRRQQNGAK